MDELANVKGRDWDDVETWLQVPVVCLVPLL